MDLLETVSLSADGNRVAVGATGNDVGGTDYWHDDDGEREGGGGLPNAGHVRVFERSGDSWVQLGDDIDGEAEGDTSGRSISLSADGSRVAVGADHNQDGGYKAGHVRVFELSGGGWVQLGADIDGYVFDESGYSVSLSANGARVAVGAPGGGLRAGRVRVFELSSGGGWVQLGADINGEHQRDNSGCSVSLSADGSRVAVGANGNEGGIYNPWPHSRPQGYNAGHVRVFELSAGGWLQLGDDIDGEAKGNQNGRSVSLSADGARVAMGAPGHGNRNRGQVRVFEWPTSSWNP